jgi:hypothetical protein
MLGSLPKLLDKNFVVGFFLPALLVVFAVAWAFPDWSLLEPLRGLAASEKKLTDLTYLGLLVWVLAILLMTGNHLLYRLLEGYVPPFSWFFPGLWWHRCRFWCLSGRYARLAAAWSAASDAGWPFPAAKQAKTATLRRKLLMRYPTARGEIMPTRFGNAIRAFEVYPRDVYGADSVPVWPRLASVIPKEYTALLDDARAQADCFVNLTFLALLLTAACVVREGAEAVQHLPPWPEVTWTAVLAASGAAGLRYALLAAGSAVAALFAYSWAIERATAWGDLVRSAFDCYLPALVGQLGYAVPPTEAERREFWTEFNALINYEQPMTPDRWPLTGQATGAKSGAAADNPAAENGKDANKDADAKDEADGAAGEVAVISVIGAEVTEEAPDGQS